MCTCGKQDRGCNCSPPLDLTKPVETRDGRPARVICTNRVPAVPDAPDPYSVIALVTNKNGAENTYVYTRSGKFDATRSSHPMDLVQARRKFTRYVTVLQALSGATHAIVTSTPVTDLFPGETIVGVQRVTVTEGDTI